MLIIFPLGKQEDIGLLPALPPEGGMTGIYVKMPLLHAAGDSHTRTTANTYSTCFCACNFPGKHRDYVIQGSAKRRSPGLVNFVAAVAYHFCLALPAAFTQPRVHFLAEPRIVTYAPVTIHEKTFQHSSLPNLHLA